MSSYREVILGLLTGLLLVGWPHHASAGRAVARVPVAARDPGYIHVEQGRVTVNLAGIPLEEVLQAISTQSRIRVVLHGPRPEPISVAFQAVPLEEALRRLMKANFLLVYAADGALAEVRVLRAPDERTLAEERKSIESLIETLAEGEPAQRREAVLALGESTSAQSVEPLAKALEEDDAAEVRQAVVSVLEKVEGSEAVAALADAVSNDSDQTVRLSAVKALATRDSSEAVDALTQALEADAEPSVRYEALVSLAEWGDDQVRDALLQALDDSEASIRAKAAEILQRRSTGGRER